MERPPILGGSFNLRNARNILWCPAYNAWTQHGGFDYRSHVKDILLECLDGMVDANGVVRPDADLRMPCLSQIDFPPSMKNVPSLLVKNLSGFVREARENGTRFHASKYSAVEGSTLLHKGLNFELLLIQEDVTTLTFIDPFPPENPWSASKEELDFLSLLLFPLKKLIGEHIGSTTVIAGVLNACTTKFTQAVDDDRRLSAMFEAMDTFSKIVPKTSTWDKIRKELDNGSHRGND